MTRALALSGGGARGSFQLGALGALYDVYGFRPDVIAGTSVGSVNGIKLALGKPPAVNDPAVILANVAAGNVDSGLAALRALEAEWNTFDGPDKFFSLQPAFKGTMIENVLSLMNAEPTGEPPTSATLGPELDLVSALQWVPIVHWIVAGVATDELQKLKATVLAVLTENAVFNLDPVSMRLNDETKLKLEDLEVGTPFYMAAVAVESGRLRYIDAMGTFTERDGTTPVASALTSGNVDEALDENLQPLDTARKNTIKGLVARYSAAVAAIASDHATYNLASTTPAQRRALLRDIGRNKERGNYLLDALRNMTKGLRIRAKVDPRIGVLASAAMPVFFDPIVIGAERYIDGGVREIIPMEIAVRNGVTDIVGVCCSALELPETDDMANAGLPAIGLRALTDCALNEVTFNDIEAVRSRGISCTVIAPTFNVHASTVVEVSLIEISSDYGWMRACDEVQPAVPADRPDFRLYSDIIATLRLRSYALEGYIGANDYFMRAGETRDSVVTMRTMRWIIRELLAKRSSLGLPAHPQSRRWWTGWARGFRPTGPFGTTSVWSRLSAFSRNTVEVRVADEVTDPDAYDLDAGALVDAANDRVYWIVRGAAFWAMTETESTTTRTPVLVVPHGTVLGLRRIPRGSHLMAEQDTPSEVWIIRGGKRFRSTPALITASGMSGQTVAIVPPGGLDQIPDGGFPYWLGGLYISDNLQNPIDVWTPTPQVEGSSTTTAVGLTNRSTRTVTVTGLTISSDQDGGGSTAFSVTTALPFTVTPNGFVWVNVQFHPVRAGTIGGTVSVTCDDPSVAQFSIPLSTSATPIGPHGLLQITPSSLDLGPVRVGQTVGQYVTLANVGARDLNITDLHVVDGWPAGQLAIPFSWPTQIGAGQNATVYVSCTPTVRGRPTATLSADVTSATNTVHPFLQHVDVPLTATAQAPVVFLAGVPLGTFRWPFRERQLVRLDFGAAAAGSTVLRTFWIRNVGDLPLTVSGVAVGGAFGIPNATIFPSVIPPGGELAVEANFLAPSVAGTPAAGQLTILSDDPLRPQALLTVVGRSAGPHMTLQPQEWLDLGTGTPPTGTLTITSDGTDPFNLVKVAVNNPEFSLAGLPSTFPWTMAPSTSLPVTVTFTGTNPGQHQGQLVVATDAGHDALVQLRAAI